MFIVARPALWQVRRAIRSRPTRRGPLIGPDTTAARARLGAMTRLTRTPPSLETVASRIFLSASASFASASFTAASSSAALGAADAVCSVRCVCCAQILEFRDPPLGVSKLPRRSSRDMPADSRSPSPPAAPSPGRGSSGSGRSADAAPGASAYASRASFRSRRSASSAAPDAHRAALNAPFARAD